MGVVLHDGNLPWGKHVILGGVTAFTGQLRGGPYTLTLVVGDTPMQRLLVGAGDFGEIRITFEGDCRLEKVWWGAAR